MVAAERRAAKDLAADPEVTAAPTLSEAMRGNKNRSADENSSCNAKAERATNMDVDYAIRRLKRDRHRNLLRGDTEALSLFDEAVRREPGRPADGGRETGNNVTDSVGRPEGNTAAKALRRLRKDAPTLHERVAAGELSRGGLTGVPVVRTVMGHGAVCENRAFQPASRCRRANDAHRGSRGAWRVVVGCDSHAHPREARRDVRLGSGAQTQARQALKPKRLTEVVAHRRQPTQLGKRASQMSTKSPSTTPENAEKTSIDAAHAQLQGLVSAIDMDRADLTERMRRLAAEATDVADTIEALAKDQLTLCAELANALAAAKGGAR